LYYHSDFRAKINKNEVFVVGLACHSRYRSKMTTNINEIIANLPPERQAKIQARAAELIAEEETLQNLR
jgi:adenylate kinase